MSDVLTCARRKRIARMIIEAGREKWASKKREQPGLLAPQSASPMEVVSAGWELIGGVSDFDRVYDLGCGDGRWVLWAAQNAQCVCHGVDISESLLTKGMRDVERFGLSGRVTLSVHDLNAGIDGVNGIEKATIVIVYLLPEALKSVGDAILNTCAPGTKVLSVAFRLDPNTWPPVARMLKADGRSLYLYEL